MIMLTALLLLPAILSNLMRVAAETPETGPVSSLDQAALES